MGTQIKFKNKGWKAKAKDRGERLRRSTQELKRQKARALKWRSRYYAQKKNQDLEVVKGYNYPLELIWMAVLMHINYGISLRGVSKSVTKLGQLLGLKIDYISHMTIRNWCLKVGLFSLLSPLKRGKYVIISDESVQIGREYLLLLLVVPIELYSPISPLKMADVKVLDLGVQQSWTAAQVAQKINQKVEAYDLEIVYGISDKCSKLRRAMKECGIAWVGDCTHEMANVSKSIFKKDIAFKTFVTKMNLLRSKWMLSKHTLLMPRALRSKCRFNKMFIIHKWAEEILKGWEGIEESAKEELLFVQKSKSLIIAMRQCYEIIELFCTIFKTKGIQNNSLKQWSIAIQGYAKKEILSEKADQFIRKMNSYLTIQKTNIKEDIQILCCSDIIESTFGRYKNKKVKIITEDVLKIAGYSKERKLSEIKQAMENIKTEDVIKWKEKNTPVSKLALIKRKKKSAA